jgi:hypothetical protein
MPQQVLNTYKNNENTSLINEDRDLENSRPYLSSLRGQERLSYSFLARQMMELPLVMGNGYIFYNSLRHIAEKKFDCNRQQITQNHTQIVCPNRIELPASVLVGLNAWYVNSVLAYRSTNEFLERFFSADLKGKLPSVIAFGLGLLTISPVTLYGMNQLIHKHFRHMRPIEIFDFSMSILSTLANAFVYGNSYFHLQRILQKLKQWFIQASWPTKMAILSYSSVVVLATLGYGYNNYRYFQPAVYEGGYTPGRIGLLERLGIDLGAGLVALLRFPLLVDSGVQLLEFLSKETLEMQTQWRRGQRISAMARILPSLGFFTLSGLSTLSITNITQQSIEHSHPCPSNRSAEVQRRCHNGVNIWSWIDSVSVAMVAAVINFISLPGSFSSPQRILSSLILLLSITLFVGLDSLVLDHFRPIDNSIHRLPRTTSSRSSFWQQVEHASDQLLTEPNEVGVRFEPG